ncbi:uncharacterized protein G2W53_042197 [Senna tora]|uniref:Uncharacterized protein n=1 Tax=Senna tora TaxID=362788 RepID=A0A834SGF5_9FABA|nr:uncharacterized protein G2W53_042197 [Senna tora]
MEEYQQGRVIIIVSDRDRPGR